LSPDLDLVLILNPYLTTPMYLSMHHPFQTNSYLFTKSAVHLILANLTKFSRLFE